MALKLKEITSKEITTGSNISIAESSLQAGSQMVTIGQLKSILK